MATGENIGYYYCTVDTFMNITKNSSVFLSDILKMNDSEELIFPLKTLYRETEKAKNLMEEAISNQDIELASKALSRMQDFIRGDEDDQHETMKSSDNPDLNSLLKVDYTDAINNSKNLLITLDKLINDCRNNLNRIFYMLFLKK